MPLGSLRLNLQLIRMLSHMYETFMILFKACDYNVEVVGCICVQWMTAGRGIVHCEMPATKGLQRGLQLWVNLSSKDKM